MAGHNVRREGDRPRHSRSHSPRLHKSHHHRHRSRSPLAPAPSKTLPFGSRELTRLDYAAFKPMFGLYLDIQKGKMLEDMNEVEVKGRWKSFIGKWNRGELAEGWYDPYTLRKALESALKPSNDTHISTPSSSRATATRDGRMVSKLSHHSDNGSDSSDDSVGPMLPGQQSTSKSKRMGPSLPNMQDLELKKEMEIEDGFARRDDIRYARKLDRKEQKAALDELVPRAEAGTRERQLEKKKEVNEKMKSFREKSPGAAEVPDTELMGEGDGIEGYKKQKQEFERKKNERELRKDEILRARMAEREERLQGYKLKEENTMAMLKALAKQNFG